MFGSANLTFLAPDYTRRVMEAAHTHNGKLIKA